MDRKITVIGVGRLGLGLALLFAKAGHHVCGVDVSPDYVRLLNSRKYKTKEPRYEELLRDSENFYATTDLEEGLNHSDVIFIVVQTPNSGGHKFYDHSILSTLLVKVNKYRVTDKHFIIGCTVMPRYIDEVGQFLVSDCERCTVSYNPEFIAQGEIVEGFTKPDVILIGTHSAEVGGIQERSTTRL